MTGGDGTAYCRAFLSWQRRPKVGPLVADISIVDWAQVKRHSDEGCRAVRFFRQIFHELGVRGRLPQIRVAAVCFVRAS